MTELSDYQLIESIRDRDEKAFKTLVDRYKQKAMRLAWRYTKDMDSAEDIVQEAFIQVWRSAHSFEGQSNFNTWFYRIIVNKSLNEIKKNKRYIFSELKEDTAIIRMENTPMEKENTLQSAIQNAMQHLSKMQRIIFSFRHLDGLSTSEVSSVLNISEGSVKQHLFRAIKKLNKTLTEIKPAKEWGIS